MTGVGDGVTVSVGIGEAVSVNGMTVSVEVGRGVEVGAIVAVAGIAVGVGSGFWGEVHSDLQLLSA